MIPFVRRALLLLALFGFSQFPEGVFGQEVRLALQLPEGRAELFQRVEIQVRGMPAATNAFDPEVIRLDLEVTAPSGKRVRVPGFYARDYERKLQGGNEVLTARGEGDWRIRWLPVEPGRHTLTAIALLRGAEAGRATGMVEVDSSTRHGLVRVEPESKRYFQLTDGTPLFLSGLCSCWHGKRGTYDYDDWLSAYEKAGINYIRIWMWPEAFGIEYSRGDRVQYHLDHAWQLDRVLSEAEKRGVYVMLCFDYHGMFETKPDYWGGNDHWVRNPYNATNGGPCQVQNDFFTSEAAKAIYAKRLRYLVARWSAFPNLLAWEFFNEIDNEYKYLKHDDVVAWHADMGSRLRALDPCSHLITSSFTGGSVRPGLYTLPEMDFAQYHSYNEKHPAQMMAAKAASFLEKNHKPFFVSEYGTDWRGWKPDTDPYFRALHQAIWSGVFTGAAGTGMTWWWENIHSANMYQHWSALSGFLKGTAIGSRAMQPATFDQVTGPILPYGVATPDQALIWLVNRACDWPEGATNAAPDAVRESKVALKGITDGSWSVEWWDTLEGKVVSSATTSATGGQLMMEAPPFAADIAARLKRK